MISHLERNFRLVYKNYKKIRWDFICTKYLCSFVKVLILTVTHLHLMIYFKLITTEHYRTSSSVVPVPAIGEKWRKL